MKFLSVFLVVATAFSSLFAAEKEAEAATVYTGRISSGDTVSISVFREPDLKTVGQLAKDGSLSMPFIKKVRLQGLTTSEAERMIEAKLRDGYLVRPEVTVRITGRVIKTVSVMGEARNPGVFTLPRDRPLKLSEVVAMAGGPTEVANEKKIILKRDSTGKTQTINLRNILTGKIRDVILESGDVVTIPESWF